MKTDLNKLTLEELKKEIEKVEQHQQEYLKAKQKNEKPIYDFANWIGQFAQTKLGDFNA